jgi:thymidylate kinase
MGILPTMLKKLINVIPRNDFMPPQNEVHGLRIIRDLCDSLEQHNINYCHWKSNTAIHRSANGQNDLDLLVSLNDMPQFLDLLLHLGFKKAEVYPKYQLPGIYDYYGLDHQTGILVHAHVHDRLTLGHDATKNYHIPIEEQYLATASQQGLFRIPSTEFEFIILIIRLILKHCTWDALILQQGKLSRSEKSELVDLRERSSENKIYELLRMHFPFIGIQLFTELVSVLASPTQLVKRAIIGQKLIRCLSGFGRYPPIIDSGLKFWRRFAWPFEIRVLRRDVRKRMTSGGHSIAIIGGDGAGKTTTVEEISKWLAADFRVETFHMGKPQWSFPTIIIRGILKIGRSLRLYPFMRADVLYIKDAKSLVFPGYPWLIREICTARDRYLTYKHAKSLVEQGYFVILDRFPISQIKFMDGPQGSRLTVNLPQNNLVRYLIKWEESYYKKIFMPDLLLLLRVDPNVAVKRKTTEIEHEVHARTSEIWEIDWSKTPAQVIDANQTKERVILEAKINIWSQL